MAVGSAQNAYLHRKLRSLAGIQSVQPLDVQSLVISVQLLSVDGVVVTLTVVVELGDCNVVVDGVVVSSVDTGAIVVVTGPHSQ